MNAEAKATHVYVISGRGRCKIGISANPKRRMVGLQTSTPDKLTLHFQVRVGPGRAREVEVAVIEAIIRGDQSMPEFLAAAVARDAAWKACEHEGSYEPFLVASRALRAFDLAKTAGEWGTRIK